MSRIYGLRNRQSTETSHRHSYLLSRAATSAGWTYETREVGPCCLGWTGPALRTGAAVVGPVTVLLDGHVLNRDDVASGADTDAVAIAQSYLRKGFEATLNRIIGEFAVALYDADEDVLWVARDRIGMKPLYYTALTDGSVAFASQPGTLLGLPGVSAAPNRDYVARFAGSHYRSIDNEPAASPFVDVSQLPAGHLLEVRHGAVRTRSWWSLVDHVEPLEGSPHELAERYRDLLLSAVEMRMMVTSRPGFTLSGGMDSSSILSSAVAISGGDRQVAYTSIYRDPTYDESGDLGPMLREKVLTWHPVAVDEPDVFALVDEMVAIHHEPVATATWLSHYLVTRTMADHGRDAIFGGMGGDELNAGEFEYFPYYFADLRSAGLEDRLAREIAGWAKHHDHPIWRKSPEVAERMMASGLDQGVPGRVRPNRDRLDRYAYTVDRAWGDLHGFTPQLDHPFTSYLLNRTYQDLFRETTPCCVRAEDRHATAFGLERFDPFLDHRVVQFMFAIPGTAKIEDGVTKQLLRTAMQGVLPEETRTRVKKTGWNAPAHLWFAGNDADAVSDLVHSARFRDRGIYDIGKVDVPLTEHRAIVDTAAPVENHMMFFWQLVNLDRWLCWAEVQDQMIRRAA